MSFRKMIGALALALAFVSAHAAAAADPGELLEPEKAFRISARSIDERNVEVEFKIADGYYMYRDRFQFATESGQRLADVQIPNGKIKEDPFFGKSQVFRDLVRIQVPLTPEEADRKLIRLKVTSQGCADIGVCYTPLEQLVQVRLPGAGPDIGEEAFARFQDWPTRLSAIPWSMLAAALAAGLGLAWVWAGAPLPVRDTGRPSARPFARDLGKAVALAAAGGLAGGLGAALEESTGNPWLAAPLALGYLGLALWWMRQAHRPKAVAHAASLAQSIPLLAAVLLFVAFLGSVWIGVGLLFGVGVAGSAAQRFAASPLPVQQWALQLGALALLGMSVWIGAPLLPDPLRMAAWSALLVMIGVLCRATDPLPDAAPAALRVVKAVGFAALLWGIAVLIGAASGARDPLQPFATLLGSRAGTVESAEVRFERVKTLSQLEARLASAGRPVMLDFYADWCVSCKEMERFTFSDPQVGARMQQMLLLQADVTNNTAEDKALLQRFKLFGPPGIIFFDSRGQELSGVRVIGYQPADRFARVLDVVLSHSGT